MTMCPEPAALPLAELDKRSLLHPFTRLAEHQRRGPVIIARGDGVWVEDPDGRRYLDAAAGLWCVNVGHGRREIAEAIHRQALELPFFHAYGGMATPPAIRLADRLRRLAPAGLARVFFANSGSEANDTAIKLVWHYNILRGKPEKLKIVARRRGFHGSTIGAGSLTGLASVHRAFNLPIPEVRHVSCPDLYRGKPDGMSERDYSRRLAAELDELIRREGPETVGAFIAEPVMGSGGVLVPPEGYFGEIRAVLDRHDVLLIVDEVITGFGRLGAWFGAFVYGLRPDLMTVAKGLTSGYVPMSACLISERIWQVILDASPHLGAFGHGFTYSGHPVAAAAALANLDVIERDGLIDHAHRIGAYFQRRLREAFADHPLVGDVRGAGLMLALELVRDKAKKTPFEPALGVAARVQRHCFAAGLIIRGRPETNSLACSPPLVISADEIEILIERLGRGLALTGDELRKERVWSG